MEFQFALRRQLIDKSNWRMSLGAQLGVVWLMTISNKMLNRDEFNAAYGAVYQNANLPNSRNAGTSRGFMFRSTPHFSFGLTMVNDFPINDKLSFRVKPGFFYDISVGEAGSGYFNLMNGRLDFGLVYGS